jgi:hypothetical protein
MAYSFAQKVEIDGICYILNPNNKTAEVTSNNYQYWGDISIPSIITYDNINFHVRSIGISAFAFCSNLISVDMTNSITEIDNKAFEDCESLISINIPNGIMNIGSYVFNNCDAIFSIIIPNGITIIEDGTFWNCSNLFSITIPSSVITIKDEVFVWCYALTSVMNLNPIPVDMSSSQYVFYGVDLSECTLTVPTSAVTDYQNAAIWQDFNIVGGGILVNPTVNNNLWGYTDGNALYSSGETATVTATARYSCNFINWTVNGEVVSIEETYSFTVTDDIELVANFEQHTNNVNVIINNPDYGTVTGTGSYPLNSTATLTAHAKTGYKFVNWIKDDFEMYDNPCSFTVTKDEELIVNFREKYNYTVTVNVNNTDWGHVLGIGEYKEDDVVTLIAVAATDYWFVNWSINGEIISTESVYSFIVTENINIFATFIKNPWGINDYENTDILIYPNPTFGELTINNEQLEIKGIEVFNLMGKKQDVMIDNQLGKYVLDISHLPAEMYIIRITTAEDVIVKKILKM